MRSLRILHVTPYSAEAWAYGGIPRVVAALTRASAARGHDVTCCATDVRDVRARMARRDGKAGRGPWQPERGPDGVTLRVFPNVSNTAAYHWQAFAPVGLGRYLREHARSFDVAHLHACRNLPGLIAARHLRRAGVPFVLAPHGTAPRLERRFAAKAVFDVLAGRRMLDDAAAVIAVSHAERRQLLSLGIDDGRIHIVGNPVDAREFETPRRRGVFRARFGLGTDPVVLFLGKQTPRKRLDVLVRAFARLPHRAAQLVVAGNDMGSERDTRRLVGTLGLAARVTFTGLLEGDARLDALADADVVVYPSQDEIFGLVPLEAMLAGTPVVVADDSGCGEVVRATGGGVVTPLGDTAALAAAIAGMLESPKVWRSHARSGGDAVRRRFAPDVVSAAVEDVYARAITYRGAAVIAGGAPAAARTTAGVSVVMPVRNGAATLRRALDAVAVETASRPAEIIVTDDGSTDASAAILQEVSGRLPLRVLAGYGRGAAAALNLGVAAASHPLIAQVDQDVILHPGWLDRLAAALEDQDVAAAQGQYVPVAGQGLAARVMALDLAWRYSRMAGGETDHVCTGNALYRRSALQSVGGFDESLGYGYDNDLSYRLRSAGYRMTFCRDATSEHRWREGLAGYCVQQYGLGYGRLDVVARHPRRVTGDAVSPAAMMAHPAFMALAVAGFTAAGLLAALPVVAVPLAIASAAIVSALGLERLITGIRASVRFRDPAALLFPVFHLLRDVVWVQAAAVWTLRHHVGRRTQPADSMQPRPHAHPDAPRRAIDGTSRVLAVIPAHNEAATLRSVVADLRTSCPGVDVLVVDDGSTDGTPALLERLPVRWLAFPARLGIGSAMRAGLKYACRFGYDAVVRLDADGQHRAGDVGRLLAVLRAGRCDVAVGSRYLEKRSTSVVKRALAGCVSAVSGREVTDATSGLYALGPRALSVLADHHPTGYPEPELRLFLARNRLDETEVAVPARPRRGGRSSLTPARQTTAAARVLLAMLIAPLRAAERGADHE